MFDYEIVIEGGKALDHFQGSPEKLASILSRAVNKVTRDGRSDAAKAIQRKIAFPARYLRPSEGRLTVTQLATKQNAEGKISARTRATSLATFATGTLKPGSRGGVTVSVKPGNSTNLKRVFPIKLRSGNSGDLGNMGLAIRLRPGEVIGNKRKMIRLSRSGKSNVYLLYGPSVDQVFRTTREDLRPGLEAELEAEILRLMDL